MLDEDAVTLECLFRIVDEEKCVQLELLPFSQLLLLAEAAEKYGAYAASMLCCSAMKYVSSRAMTGRVRSTDP